MGTEPRQTALGVWRLSCPEHPTSAVSWNPAGDAFFAACHCGREQFREIIEEIKASVVGRAGIGGVGQPLHASDSKRGTSSPPPKAGVAQAEPPHRKRDDPSSTLGASSNGKGGEAHKPESTRRDATRSAIEVADDGGESRLEGGDATERRGSHSATDARPAARAMSGGPSLNESFNSTEPNGRLANEPAEEWSVDQEIFNEIKDNGTAEPLKEPFSSTRAREAPQSHSNGSGPQAGTNGAGPSKRPSGEGWEHARGGFEANRNGHGPSDILRRVPPQNIDAEQSVLGAIFIADPDSGRQRPLLAEIAQIIKPDSFYREAHRDIYRAMLRIDEQGMPIDAITVTNELKDSGRLEACGGAGYISDLVMIVPTALRGPYHARIVLEKANLRRLATMATEITSSAYDNAEFAYLLDRTQRELARMADGQNGVNEFPEPLTASQWFAREEALYSRVSWVWDNILEGGGISVLAGKKGAGKSTFVRTLMLSAARGIELLGRNMQPSRVWYIDMEPGGSGRKEMMRQMGWCDEDHLHISTGSPQAGKPGLFKWLKDRIVSNGYQIVIVDTLYKLLKIEGTNDYDKGIYGQVPIEEICRETGVHFLLIHHARKNPSAGALGSIAEEILGSVSIAATAGTVMLIRKRAQVSTFQMDPPRYGEAIEGEVVLKKTAGEWIESAGSWGNAWMADARAGILAALNDRTGWILPRDLDVTDKATSQALNERTKKWLLGKLFDDKEVQRDGKGVTGDPFRYQSATGTEPPKPPKEPRSKKLQI